MRFVFYGFIALAVLFGIAIRSVDILSGNYLFGFDQGRDLLAARSIIVDHKLTLIGAEIGSGSAGFMGVFHGPFHYYFLAISLFLSGGDPYSATILTFIYGLLTIILGFIVGNKIFGKPWGFLIASLVALSPPLISASRFEWAPHAVPLLILLIFFFVYRICVNNKDKKNIFFSAFLTAFLYNFEFANMVPMTILLVISSIFLFNFRSMKQYAYLFSGFLLGFLPIILFNLKHNFITLHGISSYFLKPQEIQEGRAFLDFGKNLYLFIHNAFDSFPKQNVFSKELIVLVLIFFVLFSLFREKEKALKKFVLFLFLSILTTYIVLLPLRTGVYNFYLLHLVLAYIFLLTYVLVSSIQRKRILITAGIFTFLFVAYSQYAIGLVDTIKKDFVDYGSTSKIRGRLDALDFIYKGEKSKNFCLLFFAPPVYTYAFDYLAVWYGQKKYGYIPCNEKKGTFYLLMEPDPYKPWSYKGWLETVIKTGKVTDTVRLPSGFIVQKRIVE